MRNCPHQSSPTQMVDDMTWCVCIGLHDVHLHVIRWFSCAALSSIFSLDVVRIPPAYSFLDVQWRDGEVR